jgi:sodium/hydrogen antiporter
VRCYRFEIYSLHAIEGVSMNLSAETLPAALAIIGLVVIISALLSGLVDRSGLPQVGVFLTLGLALGPFGLALVSITLDSPALRVVALLSLTLVLFTDAVSLNIRLVQRSAGLAFRLLGPGTLLTAAIIGFVAWWLLHLSIPAAAILGSALASTDPVLLRGLFNRRDIPESARHPLRLESGLNDAVLLPVVLVGIVLLKNQGGLGGVSLAKLGLNLFILGPGAGILIGLLGVAALDLIRKKLGIRRDYESLYSLGIAFTAFAAAESVHASGFLAAFAAGMTIAALDVELCDCFVEYGAVTAEMLLMFTFVLLGSSLIWSGLTIISWPTLAFTAIAVLIRTPVYLLSLLGSSVDMRGRLVIAWFGPRGLSSLLLVLLPVFAGVPGSDQLFAVCSLVVLVSIVLHGGSPLLLARLARRRAMKVEAEASPTNVTNVVRQPQPVTSQVSRSLSEDGRGDSCPLSAASTSTGKTEDEAKNVGSQSISIDELRRLWQSKEPVVILDVRTERSIEDSALQAAGAIRMPPDNVVERAKELGLDKNAWLVAYCA